MKLGIKIRYIILPLIVLATVLVTNVYYGIYKAHIIENKIYSLNEYLKHKVVKAEYDLVYVKSYLRHKIDSKEASLIFTKNERSEKLEAPYISQFLEQFIDNEKTNSSVNIINDFVLYDANAAPIVHINTLDPFAEPILQPQTKTILGDVKNNTHEKISQYYYFVDNTKERLFNIIQVFSPYHLTSQQFYNAEDDLYIVQAQIGLDLLRVAVANLVDDNNKFIISNILINNKKYTDKVSINFTAFRPINSEFYQAKIATELFDIDITLNNDYFTTDLNAVLIKLVLLNFIIIVFSYIVVVKLIEQQIILPITRLAKSIKKVEASDAIELKPLTTNDEVSDLNGSYILLINKINNLANNDSLTGLANRRSFNDTLSSISTITKEDDLYTALFFIDLDNFKYVNDTFGHNIGDQLLVDFSQKLTLLFSVDKHQIKDQEIKSIARLGGDEFVILMDGLSSINAIEKIGQRICDLFHDAFNIEGNQFNIHASVGIAYSNEKINDGEVLLNQSDNAMYLAKKEGKNHYKLFTSSIADEMANELKIENQLIETLNTNTLRLVFMPTYSTDQLRLKGYEVLLRCPALSDMNVGPDVFIPIAEKSDLILMIDLWVAENAFIKLKELTDKTGFKGFFAINVSPKSLRNDHFYVSLKTLFQTYQVDPKQIELEITETCLMPDDRQAILSLEQLKSLGVNIALDDFGTGYTSFSQLVNYPLDTLKIDRSFVQALSKTPPGKKPTLDIIYELAQAYELDIIVEGVETETELEHVRTLPNAIVQGYYFTVPRQWKDVLIECNKPPH